MVLPCKNLFDKRITISWILSLAAIRYTATITMAGSGSGVGEMSGISLPIHLCLAAMPVERRSFTVVPVRIVLGGRQELAENLGGEPLRNPGEG
jgi:hypothetical protein